MSRKDERLFSVLEPPAGGLQRLRERLDAETTGWTWQTSGLALAASLAMAVLAAVWWRPPTRTDLFANEPAAIRYGMGARLDATVQVPSGAAQSVAVQEVSTGSDDVIFYWVSSTRLRPMQGRGGQDSGHGPGG